MTNESDLIQKLMVSKAIMEKHNTMGRGDGRNINVNIPEVEEYSQPKANYNIPQEFMSEDYSPRPVQNPISSPSTPDRIMNSKLPDEIKQLMMEHPIVQPNNMSGPTLSNDLIEKASRLMNKANGQLMSENNTQKKQTQNSNYNISADDIRSIVRETVEDVLKENGLLVESTKNSNESFKFKVGRHLFEGKVTKIRKVSE